MNKKVIIIESPIQGLERQVYEDTGLSEVDNLRKETKTKGEGGKENVP